VWGGYRWTQTQYFVGIHDNQVAVFRGFHQDIGPLTLSRPVLIFDVDTQSFEPLFISRLTDTIPAYSYDDAVTRAEDLIVEARRQETLSPAGTTAPPTPSGGRATNNILLPGDS